MTPLLQHSVDNAVVAFTESVLKVKTDRGREKEVKTDRGREKKVNTDRGREKEVNTDRGREKKRM